MFIIIAQKKTCILIKIIIVEDYNCVMGYVCVCVWILSTDDRTSPYEI